MKPTTAQDPIVAEIHCIREQLWRECHGSAEEMAERHRRLQEEHNDRLIDPDEWKSRRKGRSSFDVAKRGTVPRRKKVSVLADIQGQIDYWLKSSRQDHGVGDMLMKARKTRHSLFILHLAMEKLLKALVCKATRKLAPRIHSLPNLAEQAGVVLQPEQESFLRRFDKFNLAGRYPEDPSPIPRAAEALDLAREFRKVYRCLKKQL